MKNILTRMCTVQEHGCDCYWADIETLRNKLVFTLHAAYLDQKGCINDRNHKHANEGTRRTEHGVGSELGKTGKRDGSTNQ